MRKNFSHHTPAFSLLELVFVIVILGIVASIGSQIIAQVYDSYINQRAVHRSSVKTELATTQLVNRLAYSIPGTVIGRLNNTTFDAIENITATNYTTLEWIATDDDSFGATQGPIWSGYADVTASTASALSTPGSRLSQLSGIINNLSPSTKSISNTAILFPGTYNARTVGFSGTNSNANDIFLVTGNTGETSLNINATGKTIKEHYKLAWTAYAVVATDVSSQAVARGFKAGDALWDLTLYYDYQPWNGQSYDNGSSVPLIRNISVFKFTGSGNTIRLKLCQRESIGGEYSINTCKEKAVIR